MKNLLTFNEFLNENSIDISENKSWIYSSKDAESLDNYKEIIDKVESLTKKARTENKIVRSGNAIYLPEFVWAGGKQKLGDCVGIILGDGSYYISPIGTNKVYLIHDGLLSRFIKDGRIKSYQLK